MDFLETKQGQPLFGMVNQCNGGYSAVRTNQQLHLGAASLAETIAWHEDAILTGLIIKEDDEGFFVIVKVVKRGKHLVHFTGGRTFSDALEAVTWEAEQGLLAFRPDKYK